MASCPEKYSDAAGPREYLVRSVRAQGMLYPLRNARTGMTPDTLNVEAVKFVGLQMANRSVIPVGVKNYFSITPVVVDTVMPLAYRSVDMLLMLASTPSQDCSKNPIGQAENMDREVVSVLVH
ncbi:hypothetical protein ACEPAG_3659 [Sanghuangporus baumii]